MMSSYLNHIYIYVFGWFYPRQLWTSQRFTWFSIITQVEGVWRGRKLNPIGTIFLTMYVDNPSIFYRMRVCGRCTLELHKVVILNHTFLLSNNLTASNYMLTPFLVDNPRKPKKHYFICHIDFCSDPDLDNINTVNEYIWIILKFITIKLKKIKVSSKT